MTVQFTESGAFVAILSEAEVERDFGGAEALSRESAVFLARRILDAQGHEPADIREVEVYLMRGAAIFFVLLGTAGEDTIFSFDCFEELISAVWAASQREEAGLDGALYHHDSVYYISVPVENKRTSGIMSEFASGRGELPPVAETIIKENAAAVIRAYFKPVAHSGRAAH